eukprot:479579-Ditylum_brightwellii.AAC.2
MESVWLRQQYRALFTTTITLCAPVFPLATRKNKRLTMENSQVCTPLFLQWNSCWTTVTSQRDPSQ